jgi:hypothetical protein
MAAAAVAGVGILYLVRRRNMARSVYVLESCEVANGATADGTNRVMGVFATLRKAQQQAEKAAWPLPSGQMMVWKDMAKSSDDGVFQASITSKKTTRYSITRHHVH